MNWRVWFARDSALWSLLFAVGMVWVTVTGLIDDPNNFGIGPIAWHWIQLVAAVLTALAGKFGLSPLEKKINVETQGRLL
jgi:hypothetical protein